MFLNCKKTQPKVEIAEIKALQPQDVPEFSKFRESKFFDLIDSTEPLLPTIEKVEPIVILRCESTIAKIDIAQLPALKLEDLPDFSKFDESKFLDLLVQPEPILASFEPLKQDGFVLCESTLPKVYIIEFPALQPKDDPNYSKFDDSKFLHFLDPPEILFPTFDNTEPEVILICEPTVTNKEIFELPALLRKEELNIITYVQEH